MNFIGATYRSRNDSQIIVPPKAHTSMGDSSWNLEICSLQAAQQVGVPFPGSSDSVTGLCFFQEASPVLHSQLVSVSLSNHSLLIYAWEGRGLVYLVSFRNFLNPLSCLLPELKEPLSRMDCSAHPQYIPLFHLLYNILFHTTSLQERF